MNATLLTRIVGAAQLVVFVLYVALAIKSFDTLNDLDDDVHRYNNEEYRDQAEANLRGGRAACVLSIIVVVLFAALSSILTLTSWIHEDLVNGILHGVLLMGALYSSMFMILVGVVLQANELTVEDFRGGRTEGLYEFSYILAYALCGVYASLFVFYLWRRVQMSSGLQQKEVASAGRSAARPPTHDSV